MLVSYEYQIYLKDNEWHGKRFLKFPNNATRFCTKLKSYLSFSMNFKAFDIIYFSFIVTVIAKPTFNFERRCIYDVK